MTFRALEKSITVLEKSWKSPENLFLKKGTNPVQSVHMIITMKDEYSPVPVSNGHFNRIKLEQIIHFSMWLLLCSNNRAAVLIGFLGSWDFFVWAFCQMKFYLWVCFLCGGSLHSSRFPSFSKRSRTGGKLRKSGKISSRGRG